MSARAAVDAAFDRADAVHAWKDGLNLLLAGDRGTAHDAADASPSAGLLARTPVVVKDNVATTSLTTSCGSRILEGYVSPFDATVVTRLRAAGGIVIAKSNMDEFAMGSSTEHSAYGPARNPRDPSRVPGGSSGGSAAAVAAGIVRVALGSETGGSVRQPAAFCGVVGVKPTYGRVSRFGLVAFASSLDQVGVFGATVRDAAAGLQAIAGVDVNDATTADVPVGDYVGAATDRLDGMVIGVPREYFPASLDPAVRARCDVALDALRAAGATVRDVSLPHTEYAVPVYYIIAPAECSSNLARFDGVRYGLRIEGDGLRGMYEATRSRGFGAEVTRRILLGTYALSHGYYDAYYGKAQQVRARIAGDFSRVFRSGVHALFTPTTPTPAFTLGAITDPYEMYMSDIFTATANLAGVPGMSVPIGNVNGLPVGGQVLAPHFAEQSMFRLAFALEKAGLAEGEA
jgi:aspartyl-tRNA(Asn)/glutamyl-tRNA(Gln) amidotransferase subunit A